MGGEEGLAAELSRIVEILHDGAGDRQPVECARSTADLVEHDEASRRCVGEDVGGFEHLHHERALAGRDVVLGADAREDAVDDANAGLVGGNERSDLGHERDEGDLAQPAALARHVGAGEDHDLVGFGVEQGVIGNVFAGWQDGFEDWMPAGDDLDARSIVQRGADVVPLHGHGGEGAGRVEVGDGRRQLPESFGVFGNADDERAEDVGFERGERVFGGEDEGFVLLELGREVARGVGERLLRDVLGWEGGAVLAAGHAVAFGGSEGGGGDFQVVAEDAVVTDLERADASGIAFGAFEVGDPFPCFLRAGSMGVEFGGEAGVEDRPLAERSGRFLDQGGRQQPVDLGDIRQRAEVGQSGDDGRDVRDTFQAVAHGGQIAR